MKFHENLSGGSQDIPSGRTDRHDLKIFQNFAKTPKKLAKLTTKL
jgi:hypothetical protein